MEEIFRHLSTLDVNAAARVPDDKFDSWYELAKGFAKGDGSVAAEDMQSYTIQLLKSVCDVSALSSLVGKEGGISVITEVVDVLRKISTIFCNKPKFSALIQRDSAFASAFADTLIKFIAPIQSGFKPGLMFESLLRSTATEVLCDVVKTVVTIGKSKEQIIDLLKDIPVSVCISTALDINADSTVRTCNERLLQLLVAANPVLHPSAIVTIASRANDATGFEMLWALNGQQDAVVVNIINKRIENEQKTAEPLEVHRSIETLADPHVTDDRVYKMDCFIPCCTVGAEGDVSLRLQPAPLSFRASTTIQAALLESMQSFFVNHKTSAAEMGSTDFAGFIHVLIATDCFIFSEPAFMCAAAPVSDLNTPLERDDMWLSAWQSLAENASPSQRPALIKALLRTPTVKSLSCFGGQMVAFDEETWIATIIPIMSRLLENMKPSVTGSQEDQEIVNVLRDAIRSLYVQHTTRPTATLGKALFRAGYLALSHGYSDADRLPELLALILQTHASEESAEWIQLLSEGTLCSAPAGLRAAVDVVLAVTSTETGSAAYGLTQQHADIKPTATFVEDVLGAIATAPDAAALRLVREISVASSELIRSHCMVQRILLTRIEENLASFKSVVRGDAARDLAFLRDVADCLFALVHSTTPEIARTIFNLVAAVQMAREAKAVTWGPVSEQVVNEYRIDAHDAASTLKFATDMQILGPAALACTGMPQEDNLPFDIDAIQYASSLHDSALSQSLARLIPHFFVVSPIPAVRLAALHQLNHRYRYRVSEKCATSSTYRPLSVALLCLRSVPPDINTGDNLLLRCVSTNPTFAALQSAFSKCITEKQLRLDTSPPISHLHEPVADAAVNWCSLLKAAAPVCTAAVMEACDAISSGYTIAHEAPFQVSATSDPLVFSVGLLSSLVSRLLKAAELTAESDAHGIPDASVVRCIETVGVHISDDLLSAYFQREHPSRIKLLTSLSSTWHRRMSYAQSPPVAFVIPTAPPMDAVHRQPEIVQSPSFDSASLLEPSPPPSAWSKLQTYLATLPLSSTTSKIGYSLVSASGEDPPVIASPSEVELTTFPPAAIGWTHLVAAGPQIDIDAARADNSKHASTLQSRGAVDAAHAQRAATVIPLSAPVSLPLPRPLPHVPLELPPVPTHAIVRGNRGSRDASSRIEETNALLA